MFEEQSQKLYDGLTSKLNNIFSKKPFLATLIVSVLVSSVILVVSLDYRKGGAEVEVSNTSGSLVNATDAVPKKIEVDLSGAVKNPGVYVLNSDSRLEDLITLGGGFVSDVSSLWVSKNLNLSQNIIDGEKVYIPFEWDIDGLDAGGGVKALSLGITSGSKQSSLVLGELRKVGVGKSAEASSSSSDSESGEGGSSSAGGKVNVNAATSSELDALPGVGPAYAGRIIENRPYASFEEFKENSSLSATLAESLKDLIGF